MLAGNGAGRDGRAELLACAKPLVVPSVASLHLIFVKTLRSSYNFPHFTDEETDSGR